MSALREIRFLCLARNCQKTLPLFFDYLARLDGEGFSWNALIGENGSSDRTRALILGAQDSRISLFETAFMAKAPSRLVRMAIGRQALLEVTKALPAEGVFVCIADLDNVMSSPPDPAMVMNATKDLERNQDLFAVGATSHPYFYDLLSLRTDTQDYSSLNADIARAKKRPLQYFRFHQERIFNQQRKFTASRPIVCLSSFNGFCVYRAADYYQGSYRAPDEADICEHVTLNLSIARATQKRMLISPEMSIQMPADHAPVGFARFWFDRLVKPFIR